jgi:hypothetical protein
MSHFATKILSFSSASAKACIIHWSEWLSWFITPLGAVFVVESFTDGSVAPSRRRKENDRSNIDRYGFELCGMAVIGNTFICSGELSVIVSHTTIVACPIATFLAASCLKCSSASEASADACGPRSTASQISALVHGFPVFAGHPQVAYSFNVAAAG